MPLPRVLATLTLATLSLCSALAEMHQDFRNPRVVVLETTVAAGQTAALPPDHPAVLVFMSGGSARLPGAPPRSVEPGLAVFEPAAPGAALTNSGRLPLHFVTVQFLTPGQPVTWGMTGLPPNYKVLLENRFARVYDIHIPAGAHEPLHTHHDRVVVTLSGAQLEHLLPDGKVQPSTLATGEVVWRSGGTHVGHNLGRTDLWVIAVEPK